MGIKVKDKVVIELLHLAPACCFYSRLGALVTVMFVIVTCYAKYSNKYWLAFNDIIPNYIYVIWVVNIGYQLMISTLIMRM